MSGIKCPFLRTAENHAVDLDFKKALWSSNDWYDASTHTWHTVPVPNDPEDFNTCFVPGNLCEGGEYQVVQFPADKTAYLQFGTTRGTVDIYYWPANPEPTGEYMKWQLLNSISQMARGASDDALKMIQTAWNSFARKANALDPGTKQSLRSLLMEAAQAWWEGTMERKSIEGRPSGRNKHRQEE